MAKFEYIEWLLLWLLSNESPRFEWDSGNNLKSILKHGVSAAEVEEIFSLGMLLPLGIQIQPLVNEARFAVIGPTSTNRVLTVVFTLRNGKVRPISGRPAHKKERESYEEGIRQIAKRV